MPLQWLRDGLCAWGRHAGHPFWYVRANSHHSDALLQKADWAASRDTFLQNTPPDPGLAQLIVAGRDGHLGLQPPTMRTLGEVAQRAQPDHELTHRGHTPLGAAHATAYVHARNLTATATDRRALRARDGHTPVQRRLCVRKERLSGVAVLPQPCLLCGGPEETPVHTHSSSGPTTTRRYTRRPATSQPGIKPCGGPRGAPQAPHGRKSSAPGWCPRTQRRSSAR